jgi:Rps23 Pro-64 3,4-dihydroxylase Tpa1-like proline 4-hydroxylase
MENVDLNILGYKDKFAVIIDNVFTETECKDMIDMTETIGKYELAQVNIGYGNQRTNTSVRNNQRNLIFDKSKANFIFERIKKYIPTKWEGKRLKCLNERLSCLKYSPGEYFKPHFDGNYLRPDESELSYITVQIYLNDTDGGETRFYDRFSSQNFVDVIPKIGRVLLFEHRLYHAGISVKSGLKYCIRTDVMYSN